MKIIKKLFLLLTTTAVIAVSLFIGVGLARAQTCSDIGNVTDRIHCYEDELAKLGNQSKTLSNQIAQFDAQIRLTTLKISQTEEKIALLGGRINQLEGSLDSLSKAFTSRAVETYKMTRLGDPLVIVISAPNLTESIARFHYLEKIQEADRDLLQRLQTAQNTYVDQKTDQETLQKQLNTQKANLNSQKAAKAALLVVTRNDERKYQQLLEAARAELAVILGQGKETFMRNVSEGDTIGRVIPTASGCSSGQHLHFEVHNGNSVQDPNNYLKAISFSYDYGPDQYGYYGTVNPHGDWNWPMDQPIVINQGYGSHTFARTFYPGGTHNGIDLDSNGSSSVKAVKAGKLYGGSYTCGGRYPGALLYAKVEQDNGITTWYLHMTPQ